MKPLVFCDMDEVLVDLEGGMAKFFPGTIFKSGDPNRIAPSVFFQLLKPFALARKFATLDPAPGFKMLEHIYRIYKDRVDFAVCTSRGDYIKDSMIILEDKAKWLLENSPDAFAKVDMLCTTTGLSKARLANSHILLIDDMKKNCDAFKAAGGQALVYKAGETTHTEVCDEIDKLLNNEVQTKS